MLIKIRIISTKTRETKPVKEAEVVIAIKVQEATRTVDIKNTLYLVLKK